MKNSRQRDYISPELRQAVLDRDNNTCQYCGKTGEKMYLDHIYPFSKGGETTLNNLCCACRRCNGKKNNLVGIWPSSLVYILPKQPTISSKEYKTAILCLAVGVFLILLQFLCSFVIGPKPGDLFYYLPGFGYLASYLVIISRGEVEE